MVSIIVPVYKVERYLKRCVDSIINQTYKDLEIILVDDGSPDKCGEMCDEYAQKDNRIKVIHKKNGGLSDARNYGLDIATGEYIAFVDSDDYISDRFIEVLYNTLINNNCDIAMCSYVSTYGDEADFTYDGDIVVRSGKDQLKELIKTYNMAYVVVWTKIYKKEIFNDLRFPVGKINEDAFLNYKFYYKSQKVAYINNKMYGYFQSNNSIMRSGTYLKKDDLFVAMEERRKFLVNNNCGDELIDMSDVDYSNTLLYYYVLSKKYNTNNENAINRLENRVNKNYFNVMKENKYPIKLKLQYFLYKHFRKIFIWIKCKKVLK